MGFLSSHHRSPEIGSLGPIDPTNVGLQYLIQAERVQHPRSQGRSPLAPRTVGDDHELARARLNAPSVGAEGSSRQERDAMKISDMMHRPPVWIRPAATIHEAAVQMEQTGVGVVAIVDGIELVGVATDRDLVRRCIATNLSPQARIDSIMTMPVITIDADADLHDAYELLHRNAVRRLAVTRNSEFVGVIAIDDLIIHLAADLSDLARPVTAELLFGHRDSSVPAVVETPSM